MTSEQLQEQVNGMLHNLETEEYIRDWLRDKHSLEGERADSLLVAGWRDYKATVRKTSLMRFSISLVACFMLAGMLWFNATYLGRVRGVGLIVCVLLLPCIAYIGKQALQLVKGVEE